MSARRIDRFIRIGLWSAFLGLAGALATAQEGNAPSTLIADRVEIDADGVLVATGNVEALQGDARMKAQRVAYDPETERLTVEGPIILTQGENTVVLANSAELSTDLRDGLMKSARVVLDQQLQIGAAELNRVGGRYTQLYNTVSSSCEVCAARPVPLWQIRAKRVVHDDLEKQIYFDHAFFDVYGVPVFYVPQLRMPDPTVKRATGFLTPEIRSSDDLGEGIKLPYFIALGDHKDLTVTPYVATDYTATLELRYRQAFRTGSIELNGAVSQDSILEDELRGYFFAEGDFELPQDFELSFHIETTSDDDYLRDYDYSSNDRLDSALNISRIRRDRYFDGRVIVYESLRSEESNLTQPFRVSDLTWNQTIQPAIIGGELNFGLDLHGHQRRSEVDVEGRDVGRITGAVDWRRSWNGPWGMLLSAEAVGFLDHTVVANDSNYDRAVTEFTPHGVAELRWPWIRQEGRATHVLEPVAQLVWSPETDSETPQDESTQLEFDAANLFSISRFPAGDVRERGLRANLGVSWTRYDPEGWSLGATFGRILRQEDLGQFSGYEIFDGDKSDWLTEVRLSLPNRLSIANRATFDDKFEFSRNEMRVDWSAERFDLGSSFIWLEPSVTEEREDTTREWTVETDWQISDRFFTSLDMRYDMILKRAAQTRLGVEYQTECLNVDFAVRRRFTDYDQDEPTTDFTVQVELAGFGDTGAGRKRPTRLGCRG